MPDQSQTSQLSRGTRRWLFPVLCVGCLTVILLAALAKLTPRPKQVLAHQRQSELKTAADDEVLPLLREIADLGDAGIGVLVESLGSQREVVARGSQRVLHEVLERWQLLPADVSSPRVTALARELAEHTSALPREARSIAADLATQILVWSFDDDVVQIQQVIMDCETVLRASAGTGSSPRLTTPTDFVVPASPLIPSPLDDLPAEVTEAPSLPNRNGNSPREDESGDARRRGLEPNRPPHPLPSSDAKLIPAAVPAVGAANQPAKIAAGARSADSIARLGALEHVAVMPFLHARDPQIAHAAQAELAQRGFTNEQIEVARRMTDPDVQTRLDLTRALPRITGINARPWLFWLSRDTHPDVRIEALTVLATVQDPAVRKQVLELLDSEPDPRVVQRAAAVGLRR